MLSEMNKEILLSAIYIIVAVIVIVVPYIFFQRWLNRKMEILGEKVHDQFVNKRNKEEEK